MLRDSDQSRLTSHPLIQNKQILHPLRNVRTDAKQIPRKVSPLLDDPAGGRMEPVVISRSEVDYHEEHLVTFLQGHVGSRMLMHGGSIAEFAHSARVSILMIERLGLQRSRRSQAHSHLSIMPQLGRIVLHLVRRSIMGLIRRLRFRRSVAPRVWVWLLNLGVGLS
jgi:hypothetical protein